MTPEELREAVARALYLHWVRGIGVEPADWGDVQGLLGQNYLAEADAALAALAPFVAQIKAAAFQRGAEAMREKAAAYLEAAPKPNGDPITDPAAFSQALTWQRAITFAQSIRTIPIPEDKP